MHAHPNLAYSVGILSQFCINPGLVYVELVKHVLPYVSGTLDFGLKLDGEVNISDDVVGYIDSNFAGSKTDPKSTGGYVLMLAGATISHLSKLQSIIALSTYETEYVAICKARKETV